jgi:hypothetical protein
MKSSTRRPTRKRSVNKARRENSAAALTLSGIDELIKDGEITIGRVGSLCVATAADDEITYAMLVRRRGESLLQLLVRLDDAIDKALTLGIFTDQLNR